ncbi:delta(1)-pyrroline-2-carboxylate reductase family protein [Pusillimonas sp. MFBS29]|uniref:bifunctional Delta(1)-pyrroline-2-carboxylate/Delta(1)-piperideine-2- carboxylate reductase n=1 Tax=Pusillimonas sp. MFBS29 TaxID=2886690 RepID=UPI001D10FFA9|nr:bifunctional Delta(1)-pyrroline-2-carboxylate/Delta(1)-piperideine-2-carboxylate reductase [Pusillimonas sp. MFBS29]MCC2596952.1 delta(1)-pyrroline-2-carboxylate reductase family protein [Pusillimonas sp. MFBS29]
MSKLQTCTARETAGLLAFPDLVASLAHAAQEQAGGAITAPERQVVPMHEGQGGVMLSMPASAADICIHKLVNVVPANRARQLPTINGVVAVYEGRSGEPLCVLDGPTVTARRTAAISMLGLATFLPQAPQHVALIGTGGQADGHVQALAALYPGLTVSVTGSSLAKAQEFITRHSQLPLSLSAGTNVPEQAQAVFTLTTSSTPVYTEAAREGRLIIGVGAFKPDLAEIAPATLHASRLYVDDLAGAKHEAGDFIQAGIDWQQVGTLAGALADGVPPGHPLVFKTVGCAAWDLAAARCALQSINGFKER